MPEYTPRIAATIRSLYPFVTFESRDLMLPSEPDYERKCTDPVHHGYSHFKYAVAKAISPARICEIGVCTGQAAFAFLAACPTAEYVGIDALYEDRARGVSFVERTGEILQTKGYRSRILIANSQEMTELPDTPYDLIHVDGCHLRHCVAHDVRIAWNALSLSGFILVDDTHNALVCAGVFDALAEISSGDFDWAYFEDTWTGSILISRGGAQ